MTSQPSTALRRVAVLTEGPITENGIAFLSPLTVHRAALTAAGFRLSFVTDATDPAIAAADVTLVDGKFLRGLDEAGAAEKLSRLRPRARRIAFCDTAASTGTLLAGLLPHCDAYLKGQLLRDRSLYTRPLYGLRLFTDYYHRRHGVVDAAPEWSTPVPADQLGKLIVSWSASIADWSFWNRYKWAALKRSASVPGLGGALWPALAPRLLAGPETGTDPGGPRTHPVNMRLGVKFHKDTVAYQRRRLLEHLDAWRQTDRLSRRGFLRELRASQVVVSPFGWGERCYRDFEAFLAGACLFKADMSPFETWPDLFRAGETYVAHSWDMADAADLLDDLLADGPRRRAIARAGQAAFLDGAGPRRGRAAFVARFTAVMDQVMG